MDAWMDGWVGGWSDAGSNNESSSPTQSLRNQPPTPVTVLVTITHSHPASISTIASPATLLSLRL